MHLLLKLNEPQWTWIMTPYCWDVVLLRLNDLSGLGGMDDPHQNELAALESRDWLWFSSSQTQPRPYSLKSQLWVYQRVTAAGCSFCYILFIFSFHSFSQVNAELPWIADVLPARTASEMSTPHSHMPNPVTRNRCCLCLLNEGNSSAITGSV